MDLGNALVITAIMREASRLALGNTGEAMAYVSPDKAKPIEQKNIDAAIAVFNRVKDSLVKKGIISALQED